MYTVEELGDMLVILNHDDGTLLSNGQGGTFMTTSYRGAWVVCDMMNSSVERQTCVRPAWIDRYATA